MLLPVLPSWGTIHMFYNSEQTLLTTQTSAVESRLLQSCLYRYITWSTECCRTCFPLTGKTVLLPIASIVGRRVKGMETDVLFAWLRLNVEMWQQEQRVESARQPPGRSPEDGVVGGSEIMRTEPLHFHTQPAILVALSVAADSPPEPSIKQEWLHCVLSFIRDSPVVDDSVKTVVV